jgi:iron complex transport system ATP-binding protein
MMLSLDRVGVDVNGRRVVDDVSLALAANEFVALLGPNGAGKTTLLRAALGLVPVAAGRVLLGGEDPRRMKPEARARRAAYLPQARPLAWPISVRDAAALGRFAYGASPSRLSAGDAAAVDAAIEACGLSALQGRATDTLSGGELARTHVARALAAGAPLVVADEPIAALDPKHQWRIMETLARFAGGGGCVLAVLHDIALAARFATRIVLMREGKVLADGKDVLSAETIAATYDVEAEVTASGVAITGLR